MRLAASVVAAFTLITTTPRWGHTEATVGATREVPAGDLDYTPAVPDVSVESGQYSPRIALEVPPGPGGMAPDLALIYAKRANGPIGAGWSLSVESSIERKSKYGGVARLAADDTFWIDGQKLVLTSDGTYRTEQNDFVVYKKIVTASVVIGWTATKDGVVRTFGKAGATDSANANAVEYRDETVSSGVAAGTAPVEWRVAQERSPFGAAIAYAYTISDVASLGRTSRRHLLDKITYADGTTGRTEISFGYEVRDDVRISYANGPERIEAKRLRRVVVKRIASSTATTHYYLLLYQDAAHSPQSVLTEVKRVAVADPLAPPSAANEAAVASQSLARLGYADASTTWGDRAALSLVGDPPMTVNANKEYFSMSLLADVNADALADLIIFNDGCHVTQSPSPDPGDEDVPVVKMYTCTADHRVYLNTIQETKLPMAFASGGAGMPTEAFALRTHVFVYDAARSAQVTAFYGAVHNGANAPLSAQPIEILDLDRDGYAELVKAGRFAQGTSEGWNAVGVAANWTDDQLEDEVFADFDGDGLPDLVGQSEYRLNTGVSPFIASGVGTTLVDPVTDNHQSSKYDTASTSCLDGSDTGIYLRWDYGVAVPGPVTPDLSSADPITADEWVWRNTVNADFNGDGLMDRLISFPFLQKETVAPGFVALWNRNDTACGTYDQLFLGNGRGGFTAAGYGIGGPMQREQKFTQVQTEVDPYGNPEVTTTYSYHLNHFAMGDVDGDGRSEVTQFCNSDAAFVAMWDQGIASWRGFGPGYGIAIPARSCPAQFTATVPEEFFGLSMLDYHYATLADIDGDGQTDLFMYSHPYGKSDTIITNTGTPWEDWEDGPHWRRNQRSTAQNRLVSITGPHGGETDVTWSWSAEDPGNHFAIDVEHVESVTNGDGRTAYSFEQGAYDDGDFMGFGRVETLQPRGATLVETFMTGRVLRNKPSTEQLYDTGGRLKNLRVYLHGSEDPTVMPAGGGFGWDGIAPYYNPLLRRCEFEFGYLNGLAPLGVDLDGYIATCEAFDDEPGLSLGGVVDHRSLFEVARGGDPIALAHSPEERTELVALRDLMNGRSPSTICVPAVGDSHLAPQVCRRFTTTPGDVATAAVFGADSGATVPVTYSAAHVPSRLDLAFPASGLLPAVTQSVLTVMSRMYVNEYSYDVALGHVLEHRELRDASTRADSLVHDYQYSTWDAALAGVHLLHETTANRSAKTFEQIDYEDFVSGQWRRRVEHDTVTAATRTEKRTFTALGDVASTTNPRSETTSYTFATCGPQTQTRDPIGYAEDDVLDAACRSSSHRRLWGTTVLAQTTYVRDGYGRVTTETTDPSFGSGAMPLVTQSYAYADASGPILAERVVMAPEPDGSTTLQKTYVDEWGRPIKTVRCAAASASGSGVGLDALHPCDATQVVTETRYAPDAGDVEAVTGPYLTTGGPVPVSSYAYDEFGRRIVETDPLGHQATMAFGLGWRSATDPSGRQTTVTFDTLKEDVTVDGVYRAGTRRDAFGRIVATLDSASLQTDLYYDGYNRKSEALGPLVDVLPSGAATSTSQRLAVYTTYDAADRVATQQDPAGRTTSFSYGARGRLLTTTGPDLNGDGAGDLLETRSYVDGGYGTAKVVIRNSLLGASREERLDGQGRIWKQVAFDGTVTQTDYDSRGRAWRVTQPWGEVDTTAISRAGLTQTATSTQGTVIATTTTTFDAGGRPATVTDPDGQLTTTSYDALGRLTSATQGGRELEHRIYDYVSRPVEVRHAGATTCFTYDDADHVTLEERGCVSGGSFTGGGGGGRGLVNLRRTYTTAGRLDLEYDGTGAYVDHDYDGAGREIAAAVIDGGGVSRGRRTFGYDAAGNQTRATDELGLVDRTEYDNLDRVVAIDPAIAGRTTIGYAVVGGSWAVTTTAPTGEHREQDTDAMGRTWRTCASNDLCVDEHYTAGRLTSRDRHAKIGPIIATQYVQYAPSSTRVAAEWDWIGTLAAQLACGGVVPDGCPVPHVERTWTTAGRPDTVVDPQGNVTAYTYRTDDGSLLPTAVSQTGKPDATMSYDPTYPIVVGRALHDPIGGGDLTEVTTWDRNYRVAGIDRARNLVHETTTAEYDGAGRRTRSHVTRGTDSVDIVDAYDAHGNPTTRTYAIDSNAGNYDGVLTYAWRDNGGLASVTFPSGKLVSYAYDDAGATGRLLSATYGAAPVFEAQAPDASGRPTTLRYDTGALRVVRAFDSAGREGSRDVYGTTANKRTETYHYDTVGRLDRIDLAYGANVGSSVFTYSDRDRLLSEAHTLNGQARSFAYAYDPFTGLRTTKTDTSATGTVTTDYGYDEGNRLTAVDAVAIGWDGFGRQTNDAAGRVFAFGLADQLLSITVGGAAIESNLYDAAGLRVLRTTPTGGLELFLPGPDGQVVEHIAGTAVTDYVTAGGSTVATIDQTGNVTASVDSITGSPYRIGERTADHLYVDASAFGEPITTDGTLAEDRGFHGMFASEAPSIQIAGVRAYDTTTGRFLTADPLGLGSSPEAVDAADEFRYAQDNPVSLSDPTGYAPMPSQKMANPCLMQADGGCTARDPSYEEQRRQMGEAWLADKVDQARAYHDRMVVGGGKETPEWFALMGEVSNALDNEVMHMLAKRGPLSLEQTSEPTDSGGSGDGGGHSRPPRSFRQRERGRSPEVATHPALRGHASDSAIVSDDPLAPLTTPTLAGAAVVAEGVAAAKAAQAWVEDQYWWPGQRVVPAWLTDRSLFLVGGPYLVGYAYHEGWTNEDVADAMADPINQGRIQAAGDVLLIAEASGAIDALTGAVGATLEKAPAATKGFAGAFDDSATMLSLDAAPEPTPPVPGKIRLYGYSAEAMGENTPHFSVETVGDDTMHTEQVRVGTGTEIRHAANNPPPTKIVEFDVPNLAGARELQQLQLNKAFGPYSLRTNSCMTHCAAVLRAGGVAVPTETLELFAWSRQIFGEMR